MKIEMGESLFYSWLRHAKECQLVQTNWKVSPQWNLQNENQIQKIYNRVAIHFETKYGYGVFKQNSSLQQVFRQAECDVVGVAMQKNTITHYAVDVAFHENGLNYGSKEETVMKVVAKSVRNALCLYGYMNTHSAQVIFASPKINRAVLESLQTCMNDVNKIFAEEGLVFDFRIICNEAFEQSVLAPILLISEGVSDTSELFLRSYQLYTMFASKRQDNENQRNEGADLVKPKLQKVEATDYKELKVGQLAKNVLRGILQSNCVSEKEIERMQERAYSKNVFGIQYPLLVKAESENRPSRYYSDPLVIRGERYYLCSEWYEKPENNDRPYLERWIAEHS